MRRATDAEKRFAVVNGPIVEERTDSREQQRDREEQGRREYCDEKPPPAPLQVAEANQPHRERVYGRAS
jgi:hypothetical protein